MTPEPKVGQVHVMFSNTRIDAFRVLDGDRVERVDLW